MHATGALPKLGDPLRINPKGPSSAPTMGAMPGLDEAAIPGKLSYESSLGIPPPNPSSEFAASAEFEVMVSDIRKTFGQWRHKAESELDEDRAEMKHARQNFEEEKAKVWKEFMSQKQSEYDRIRDERKRAETEMATASKQIRQEREDARQKLSEERAKLDKELELARRRFALEKEKFRIEYEAREKEERRIAECNASAETMVEINVGGVVFETTRQTLTQQQGTFLERIMVGRETTQRDRNGRIFLDRDSELFRSVLNFLRNPEVPPPSRDAAESEALCKEADYFGIRYFPYPLVFAVGGHSGRETLATLELLDVENQCWRPAKPMATDRSYFGASTLFSRLYCFGGQNLEYRALNETECYDCLRDSWMAGPSLGSARRNCAGAQLDQRIFAVGGFDGSQILSSVEAYDPRMKNWMSLEPLLTPRSSCAGTVLDGQLYIHGGTSGQRLRTVERYDVRTNRWEAFRSDMIEVRSAAQAVTCLDNIYVVGGTDQQQTIHASLECLETGSSTWSFRKSMQVARMDFGCCVISDSVMVGGGHGSNGEVLASTEFYRPELDDWQPGPVMLSPRYGHHLLLVNL
jgi:hypothetical protein